MLREVVLRQVGGPLCPYTQYIQSVAEVWGWWWVNDSELATTRDERAKVSGFERT